MAWECCVYDQSLPDIQQASAECFINVFVEMCLDRSIYLCVIILVAKNLLLPLGLQSLVFHGNVGIQKALRCCQPDARRPRPGPLVVYALVNAVCVFITAVPITKLFKSAYLLLQHLIPSCARGGRRTVEDMCYEI